MSNTCCCGFSTSEDLFFIRGCTDDTFHRGKDNHVEWYRMWDQTRIEKKKRETDVRQKIFWAEERRKEVHHREKRGEMMDWTYEDNEEWNAVQQNVIFQTVVWGALLPFRRDCYCRWISPTKTSIPRMQHFLDFAAIEAGFERAGFESGQSASPNEAALASRWRLNRKSAHTYIFTSKLLPMSVSSQCRYSNQRKKKIPPWWRHLPAELPVV